MPKKILPAILALFLVTPFFLQVSSFSANANHESVMTSPMTFFGVVGKVTYKQLGRLLGNTPRTTGAANVQVMATGFFDKSKKYTTTTDANGDYKFSIPEGMYKITVKDSSNKANFFTPPFRVEKIKGNTANQANFQGLIFP